MTEFDILELFRKGGFFMWPLLLCSVLGVAVILERGLVFLGLLRGGVREGELRRVWQERGVDGLRERLAASNHPVAAVGRVYLENLPREAGLRGELIKMEGSRQLERVEQRLRVLATISHLAPLLGLLGTVTGLVIAFAQMQTLGGAARPADLAGGIWEALLTTVFGLIVAIPCMAAFHGFEGIADRVARRMQSVVVCLDDLLDQEASLAEGEGMPGVTAAEEDLHAVH
jgi:biopolymer transport protein ExbB